MSRSTHPQTLAGLFLIVVGLPAIALVWLGIEFSRQDRALAVRRETERRQADLQSAARELTLRLAEAGKNPPPVAVRFILSDNSIVAEPKDGLLWFPTLEPLPPAAEFADIEKLEFQGKSSDALVAYNRDLNGPLQIRAGALLRIARIHWRDRNFTAAIQAYDQLARIPTVSIEGLPADFTALRAKCEVLRDAGRHHDLHDQAEFLKADLLQGRWKLDKGAWDRASTQIVDWTGQPFELPRQRREMSELATKLHNRPSTYNGMTLFWSGNTVVAIPPEVVRTWMPAGISTKPDAAVAKIFPADTGLPWALYATSNSAQTAPEMDTRARLLSFGLASIVLLIAGAGYVLWRVVQQQLAVARLQTDFVAAVSHEFRTPLASLRHVTDLLTEDDELPKERRRTFYELLGRNTERLQRLVESLLDFARMEDGRKPYDFRPIDAVGFTSEIVADFRREAESRGFKVDLNIKHPTPLAVRADPASLKSAVWNLLDNAVKYSPDRREISVNVGQHDRGIGIEVADKGIGIPQIEQRAVFGKFVRGADSKRLGIKGTGLGLAMVSHIVHAHGGEIELESKEGEGSTFRIVLPRSANGTNLDR